MSTDKMQRTPEEILATEAVIHAVSSMPKYIGPKEGRSKHRNAKRTKARKRRNK